MTQQPITPPPQWQMDAWQARIETMGADVPAILLEAAQWGADQELAACCEWLEREGWSGESRQLRTARRPKPPSLKEQALAALERYESEEWCEEMTFDSSVIRRALEQLPN
jgi:hypothetical protein